MFGDPKEFPSGTAGSSVGISDDDHERRMAPTITEAELGKYADDCRMMALATNDPKWDALAERWLRCAGSFGDVRVASHGGAPRSAPTRIREPVV
jgi:hypothetical protein